jgi:tripartite-type tricarboxylate transporter receptor subunit TctC
VVTDVRRQPTTLPKLPYDPREDLTDVSLLGVSPLLAAVNNDAPFKTARELVTLD